MLRFLKRIRMNDLAEGQIRKYFFYAIGEIILLVIGILLALQINNWNQRRINRNLELQYYRNIKRQLKEDIQGLKGTIAFNKQYLKQYAYASQVIEAKDYRKMDTLGRIAVNLTEFSDFHRKSNVYETMVSSGEVKLLGNALLIEKLQMLEETYIYINRLELSHAEGIRELVISEIMEVIQLNGFGVKKPKKLYSYQFQNLFVLFAEHMKEKDEIYHRALKQINVIMEILDRELGTHSEYKNGRSLPNVRLL